MAKQNSTKNMVIESLQILTYNNFWAYQQMINRLSENGEIYEIVLNIVYIYIMHIFITKNDLYSVFKTVSEIHNLNE